MTEPQLQTNSSNEENSNLRRLGVSALNKHTAPMMPKGSSFDRIVPHINYCWHSLTAGPCFPSSMSGDESLQGNYVRLVDHAEMKGMFHSTTRHPGDDDDPCSTPPATPGTLCPRTGFQLNAPNNRPPSRMVPWGDVLYTAGARNALDFYRKRDTIPTGDLGFSACAHFYFNGECRRGMQCGFFHIIHVDATANPGQLASKPTAVPAKASYVEKNRQGNNSSSYNPNSTSSDVQPPREQHRPKVASHTEQQAHSALQQPTPSKSTTNYLNPSSPPPGGSPMVPMMMQSQPQQQYPPAMLQPGMMWAPQPQPQFQAPSGFVPMAQMQPAFPGNGGWVPMMQPQPNASMPQPYAAMQPMMMQPQMTMPSAVTSSQGQHSGSSGSPNGIRATPNTTPPNSGSNGQQHSSSQANSDEQAWSSQEGGGGSGGSGGKTGAGAATWSQGIRPSPGLHSEQQHVPNTTSNNGQGYAAQQQPQMMMMMMMVPSSQQPWHNSGLPFQQHQSVQQGMMFMPQHHPQQR